MSIRSYLLNCPLVPRKVDIRRHEKQKAEIAEAVWRLAARAGLESVSMREVAAEAGVSNGRVQYYFPNKEAMLLYGLQLAQRRMESRVQQRLKELPEPVDGESVLRAVLDEMLGDDPDPRQVIKVSLGVPWPCSGGSVCRRAAAWATMPSYVPMPQALYGRQRQISEHDLESIP